MQNDTTHFITRSAVRFFSGTLVSRVTGLFRDVAMATAFGTHSAVSMFLVGFRFSHLFRRLLGEGAMQTTFIPHFEKLRQEDPLRACRFFRDLTVTLFFVLILIVVSSIGVLSSVLHWGHLSPDNAQCLYLTMLMLPSLLFICLFGLNAGLLQCEKSYLTPSIAPSAFNAIWILGVLCLWRMTPPQAMPWLAGFITIACFGQWLMTLPKTVKSLQKQGLLRDRFQLFSPDVRTFIKPLFLGIAGVSATQINNALDALFAWYADYQGPAFLWYAIRLQQLPLGLFGIALSGALLPPLSRALSNNDLVKYKQFLEFTLFKSVSLMLPMTVGIFLLGEASIHLIYGRGDFDASSVIGTTHCLWGYGFGLLPASLVLLLSPAYYAKGDYRTPTFASVASVALNMALNALLIVGLGCGASSVAWATSVSAWVNVALLASLLWRAIGPYLSWSFWVNCLKVTGASATGGGALWVADHLWKGGFSTPFLVQALHLIYLFLVFGISFVGVLKPSFFIKEKREGVS